MRLQTVQTRRTIGFLAAAATLALAVPQLASAENRDRDHGGGPQIASANSRAFGKTLTQWMETYWRWYYTGADPTQSTVGRVQLMPLPNSQQVSGSWTPEDPALLRGKLEITLPPGTPFVLPEFAWVLERYQDGSEDPPMAEAVALAAAHPVLTIDGQRVLTDLNKAAYYVPRTAFDPIIQYAQPSSYGSVAALSFQGVGVVGLPLSEGVHVIHLYEPLIFPPGAYAGLPNGLGQIFDNTWIVTVAKPARVIPPDREYRGKSYGEWAVSYWQWVMGIPTAHNPLVDTTGASAGVNQSGPVWFLAGTLGGSAQESITVPAGKAIFMPVHQWIFGATVNDCEPSAPGVTCDVPTLRASAAAAATGATVLDVSIDGRPVPDVASYRTLSPGSFSLTLPSDNVPGLPAGTYGPHVADGYWLMLAPLSPGKHVITVHVVNPVASIEYTVLYDLTVTGEPEH